MQQNASETSVQRKVNLIGACARSIDACMYTYVRAKKVAAIYVHARRVNSLGDRFLILVIQKNEFWPAGTYNALYVRAGVHYDFHYLFSGWHVCVLFDLPVLLYTCLYTLFRSFL